MADHPHCVHLDLKDGAVCCFCGMLFAVRAGTESQVPGHGRYHPINYVILGENAEALGADGECKTRASLEQAWAAEFN